MQFLFVQNFILFLLFHINRTFNCRANLYTFYNIIFAQMQFLFAQNFILFLLFHINRTFYCRANLYTFYNIIFAQMQFLFAQNFILSLLFHNHLKMLIVHSRPPHIVLLVDNHPALLDDQPRGPLGRRPSGLVRRPVSGSSRSTTIQPCSTTSLAQRVLLFDEQRDALLNDQP